MDYKQQIAEIVAKAAKMDVSDILGMLEIPSDESKGDFALPCFKLARTMRMAPPKIAQQLFDDIDKPDFVSSMENVGGYLNFFIDKNLVTKNTLMAIDDNYGKGNVGEGKTICIDYSSVNIAKKFHIGHLSTTVIGHSLYRIYENLGYNVVGINHLGDWGTQFGKLIVALKKWSSIEKIEQEGVDNLIEIYIKYHEEAEKNPALDDEARAWFKRIEEGDSEAMELFTMFREITLTEANKIYDRMDIHFDSYKGESFYSDKMDVVVDELARQGLMKKDDGAMIVDLEEYKMPPSLILKSDGATLYTTRDIATAVYRADTYDFEKCLYVVAYQQDLHFRQFFKVIELMGYEWAKKLEHVSYGMVSLEDGAMSTRKGKMVYLDELLDKAVAKASDIINEKNPDLPNKEETAEQVGIGAVIFQTLKNNRIKDITFKWEVALNFEGETGPYVQYTHARCCSLLKKSDIAPTQDVNTKYFENDDAAAVIKMLSAFGEAIEEAQRRNEPYTITRYLIRLSQAFNKYYFEHQILDDDKEATANRLKLADSVRITLKNGLYLLGIKAPERM